MVVRGWDSCGLRCMFDDRREETVRKAKRAMWDQSHELYPLFPHGNHTEPLSEKAITSEAMQHVYVEDCDSDWDEQLKALTPEDAVNVDAVRLVRGEIAFPTATARVTPQKSLDGKKVYPMFTPAREH